MENITLEKIDALRERSDLGYKEAKEVLEMHEGDLVEALIYLEEKASKKKNPINETTDAIVESVKDLVRKGNVTKIHLMKDDEIIMNIPVSAGAIGALLAPALAALGFAVAIMSNVKIEVIKEDGEVIDINCETDKAVEKIKDMTNEAVKAVKEVSEEAVNKVKCSKEEEIEIVVENKETEEAEEKEETIEEVTEEEEKEEIEVEEVKEEK